MEDTANWMRLKWDYTAQGFENYFIIGCFRKDNEQTRKFVNPIMPFFLEENSSYYYIDNVSIIPKDSLQGMEDRQPKNKYGLRWDGSTGCLMLESSLAGEKSPTEIAVYNMQGVMQERKRISGNKVCLGEIQKGIYVVRLLDASGELLRVEKDGGVLSRP